MQYTIAVICAVSMTPDFTIQDEQVGRFVYKNIQMRDNGNQTIAIFTIINQGNKAQAVCSPELVGKAGGNRDVFIKSLNGQSSDVPNMIPGKEYKLYFVFPRTGLNRMILYSGGFRGAATKRLYRY